MRTPKDQVLFHMMEQLPKYSVADRVNIPEWETYDGNYKGEGKYEFFPENKQTIKL